MAPVEDTTRELRVSSRTSTADLAAAISHAVHDGQPVTIRAVGAGAVNQAVKGLAKAQGFVAQRGLNLVNRPGFLNIELDGEDKTAIVFRAFCI